MKNYNFFIFLILLSFPSCKNSNFPDKSYDIQIDNNSNKTIKVYLALERAFIYPDTLIEKEMPAKGFRTINPNRSTYFDSRITWQEIYNKYLPSDTLSIYIFDADTINSYDWQTIRKEYKILSRYDLSLDNLKYLGYRIAYPIDNRMNGIKMYP